jgi:outer membrane autotransporter protein
MWFDTAPDAAEIETWQVNFFASYGFGRFYLDGQGSYAWHDIATLRSIDLPAPAGSDLATAEYDASSWSVNGELGAIWRLGRVNMQPSLAVAYVDSSADGFTESSTTGYSLIVSGADGESLSTTLALRASGQWMMAKTPVVPDFKIGWRHEYMDDNSTFSAAFFDDPTVAMSIVSSQVKADSLVISSGATFGVTRNFEVFFDVNGQYNADASLTNASGGVRLTW